MPENLLNTFLPLFINPIFRWVLLAITIILTLFAYIQEPIRFSGRYGFTGLNYKIQYYVLFCITLFVYFFNLLSLEYTIPFSKNLPYLWYIPIIIICYSIITDITFSSKIVDDKDGNLEPPPSYLLPKKYRLIIYYFIILFDIMMFLQSFVYSGISTQFNTTILYQFILNRFGGFKPGNIIMFIISWLGIIGLGLDAYMINNQYNFSACMYGLPESWNF
jgi:hypothetical protein